jgi:putative ABC transport system permease protein
MMTLSLAVRNVFRNRRRSLHTLLAIVVGIAALVVFQGFIADQMRGFRESVIKSGIGHLQVAAKAAYFSDGEFNPGAYQIADADALARKIAALPEVKELIPVTGLTALAAYGDKTITLLVKGYPSGKVSFSSAETADPDTPYRLGRLVAGKSYTRNPEIVLGAGSAAALGVQPGSVLTLMGVAGENGLNGLDVTVSGVFEGANDALFAYLDYPTALVLNGTASPAALTVICDSLEAADRVAAAVRAFDDGVAIKTWKELAVYFGQVEAMYAAFLQVIRTILLLITLFVTANALTMAVFERMREIGTLRAVGTTRIGLFALIFLEGGVIGLAGSLAGVLAGYGLSALFNVFGGVSFLYEKEWVRIAFRPTLDHSLSTMAVVTVFAFFGAIVPAWKAARLTVAETLRSV